MDIWSPSCQSATTLHEHDTYQWGYLYKSKMKFNVMVNKLICHVMMKGKRAPVYNHRERESFPLSKYTHHH